MFEVGLPRPREYQRYLTNRRIPRNSGILNETSSARGCLSPVRTGFAATTKTLKDRDRVGNHSRSVVRTIVTAGKFHVSIRLNTSLYSWESEISMALLYTETAPNAFPQVGHVAHSLTTKQFPQRPVECQAVLAIVNVIFRPSNHAATSPGTAHKVRLRTIWRISIVRNRDVQLLSISSQSISCTLPPTLQTGHRDQEIQSSGRSDIIIKARLSG
ncbi:hypothetical protein RRG08_017153 [Elysia crispata]|uniref:Uncharacterized protein n=1 Tax=Elysia crispata TaxID=231223 RepID=A0AAE1E9V3_9GAST|nr:hypothetical protein RRG08_017153 [Elysia crispata]